MLAQATVGALTTHECRLAGFIDAVHGKTILGQIGAGAPNSLGPPLLNGEWMRNVLHFPSWHWLPNPALPRAPQDGEFLFIR